MAASATPLVSHAQMPMHAMSSGVVQEPWDLSSRIDLSVTTPLLPNADAVTLQGPISIRAMQHRVALAGPPVRQGMFERRGSTPYRIDVSESSGRESWREEEGRLFNRMGCYAGKEAGLCVLHLTTAAMVSMEGGAIDRREHLDSRTDRRTNKQTFNPPAM